MGLIDLETGNGTVGRSKNFRHGLGNLLLGALQVSGALTLGHDQIDFRQQQETLNNKSATEVAVSESKKYEHLPRTTKQRLLDIQ